MILLFKTICFDLLAIGDGKINQIFEKYGKYRAIKIRLFSRNNFIKG